MFIFYSSFAKLHLIFNDIDDIIISFEIYLPNWIRSLMMCCHCYGMFELTIQKYWVPLSVSMGWLREIWWPISPLQYIIFTQHCDALKLSLRSFNALLKTEIYRLMVTDKRYGLNVNSMACRALPLLVPQTVNPSLNLEQYQRLMEVWTAIFNYPTISLKYFEWISK